MSQASALNIYFVLPKEDKNAECSNDMCEAFACIKQYKGKPQWVLPSFCLNHLPLKSDVFVFEEFKGPAFEHLKKNSAKILGARCMLTCMSAGDKIPPGVSPIFTEAMRDLMVCSTGFEGEAKKVIQEKVEYMGGNYDSSCRVATTHLIAKTTLSLKAIQAFNVGKPVMKREWVDAVWERGLVANIRGSDAEFDIYRAPIFHNITMTSSGMSKREKEKLKDLVIHHGGIFQGVLTERETHVLLISNPVGEKYKAAKKWKIKCIKPSWILKCAGVGKIINFNEYLLVDSAANKVSTPQKSPVDLTSNFSCLSAIGNDEAQMTHLEETAGTSVDITISQPARSQLTRGEISEIINCLLKDMKDAGQFLDGCNVYLAGFNQEQLEKLKKILNFGGATRFDELTQSVTHIVTNGTAGDAFKESGAHVLKLDWLVESLQLRRPAPVEKFNILPRGATKETPPSPLSKQGAMLLTRPEPIVVEDDPLPIEDNLLERYNQSQQGEPLALRQNEKNTPSKSSVTIKSQLSPSCTQNTEKFFTGLKFFLSRDLSEEEYSGAEEFVTKAGGSVVTKKFSGVYDYAIVPLTGAPLSEVTAREVVNLFFVKDCFLGNQIIPLQYYHLPVTWVLNATPLEGCVLSVSQYVGSEREFVEAVIDVLGGKVQPILARRPTKSLLKTTHLICPEPSGVKYEGALRWGLPIVHHDWLLKCSEKGQRVSEEPYLIGDSKLGTVSSNFTAATSKPNTPASTKKAFAPDEKESVIFNSKFNTPASTKKVLAPEEKESLFSNSKLNTPAPTKKTLVPEERESPTSNSKLNTPAPTEKTLVPEERESPISNPKLNTPVPTKKAFFPEEKESPIYTPLIATKQPLQVFQNRTPKEQVKQSVVSAPSPVNKALEKVRQMATPTNAESPDSSNRTLTPTSPYGAFYGNDNPSPGTRKRLYKWINQGAEFPIKPPVKPHEPSPETTPVSALLSRQLKLMMCRQNEDGMAEESCSPAKRPTIQPDVDSTKKDLISGLQKMREIEESYSKVNAKVSASPARPSGETKMVIVAQSQPHTEIGWEDPSDREAALATLEKNVEQVELPPKIFMLSGLGDNVETVKKLLEESGGKVSPLSFFDKSATHLVTASNMARAEKLMGSISAGLWILHPSYLKSLEIIKDVYALKEEDYEWGNPNATFSKDSLQKHAKDCIDTAYKWRIDIKVNKKPPPFSGLKIILNVSANKCDSFRRLIQAGGGEVVFADDDGGDNVFCVCDVSKNVDFENLAKKGIRCVTLVFINDIILRKPNAVIDNMIPGFSELWKKYGHDN